MQRYFAEIVNNNVYLQEQDVLHLTKVMRVKPHEHIEVVDQNHNAFIARIESLSPLDIKVVEPILKNSELDKPVTLFFALAKSDKIELVIQKATELGASKIVLFQGERSVVKFSQSDFVRKEPRFLSIMKEASEQCHREYIPEIYYEESIKGIEKHLADLNLFAYELEAGKDNQFIDLLNQNNYKSISIIVGPEGGFSEKEAEYLDSLNFHRVSLGKRILRCETAAIYSLSVIASQLEK